MKTDCGTRRLQEETGFYGKVERWRTRLSFPILIGGGIGGTIARFALLLDAFAAPKEYTDHPEPRNCENNRRCAAELHSRKTSGPAAFCGGQSWHWHGTDRGRRGSGLTNWRWVVQARREMIAKLGFEEVLLVNDFEAQALAVASLSDE